MSDVLPKSTSNKSSDEINPKTPSPKSLDTNFLKDKSLEFQKWRLKTKNTLLTTCETQLEEIERYFMNEMLSN